MVKATVSVYVLSPGAQFAQHSLNKTLKAQVYTSYMFV